MLDLLRARLDAAALDVPTDKHEQLAAYLALLAKWNRTINLTAFDLNAPTDAAIDRLIIEPVIAARHVSPDDARVIDIGSGGGSPALPFRIMAPQLALTMIESKSRKSSFLREVARALALSNVTVETSRAEDIAVRPDLIASADLVTLRAVHVDAPMWAAIGAMLTPSGRMFWFGPPADLPEGARVIKTVGDLGIVTR
jgi:16S rRNA (guanine527-N7)-methyltransferase